MSRPDTKITQLVKIVKRLKKNKKKIVFTNGCFDILHIGHIRYLKKARELGDVLVVAVNSDLSVRKIKGKGRPVFHEKDRVEILSALEFVDYVTIFHEFDPVKTISKILPDVLVKGKDWPISKVLGGNIVKQNGGKVVTIPVIKGYSTSRIVAKIMK